MVRMMAEGLEVIRPVESYGKTVERVLEDLMGLETTRPADVAHALKQIYEQIAGGALVEAANAIGALEQKIGGDPELVKAKVLIKRRELIGK